MWSLLNLGTAFDIFSVVEIFLKSLQKEIFFISLIVLAGIPPPLLSRPHTSGCQHVVEMLCNTAGNNIG
jgi:hypothetical protein